MDIHVTHRWAREFKHFLTRREISFRVKIRNLQRLINGERMRARSGVPFNGAFRSYSQVSLKNAVYMRYFVEKYDKKALESFRSEFTANL